MGGLIKRSAAVEPVSDAGLERLAARGVSRLAPLAPPS